MADEKKTTETPTKTPPPTAQAPVIEKIVIEAQAPASVSGLSTWVWLVFLVLAYTQGGITGAALGDWIDAKLTQLAQITTKGP